MKYKNILLALLFIGLGIWSLSAQISPGVYYASEDIEGIKRIHQLKVSDHYFIYSVYEEDPARFIKTLGGPIELTDEMISSELEFNSNYSEDNITRWDSNYSYEDEGLALDELQGLVFEKDDGTGEDLSGAWLFATRGPDEGQERRGEAQERKTLKFLMDGTFQWIAYHTGTMAFSGTGGGSYTADDGEYIEKIKFFSRDSSRVGAELKFSYEVDGDDWHHKGKNSRGQPMYEIWSKRESSH